MYVCIQTRVRIGELCMWIYACVLTSIVTATRLSDIDTCNYGV